MDHLRSGPKADLSSGGPGPMTKTSLAANKQNQQPIGSTHNVQAKPFPIDGNKVLVHTKYNNPAGLYSMNNIAETLSAQASVLNTGAVGINFMKEKQPVNTDSAVYRMIQEETKGENMSRESSVSAGENGEYYPLSESGYPSNVQSQSFLKLQQQLHYDGSNSLPNSADGSLSKLKVVMRQSLPDGPSSPVTKSVSAPVAKPPSETSAQTNQNLCFECGRLIIGVFVKINDKPLHSECFKCATCGSSLKNVGYHNINEKLYCSLHATQVARIATAPGNVSPVALGGGQPKVPAFILKKTSPSVAPHSPGVGVSSPIPFHGTPKPRHVDAPASPTPSSPFFSPPSQTSQQTNRPMSVPSSFGSHPSTAPAVGVHKESIGGSKFTWPPSGEAAGSETTTVTETSTSSYSSYRPPPDTQKIQYQSKALSNKPKTPPATASKPIFAPKSDPVSPYGTTFGSPVSRPASTIAPVTPPAASSKPYLPSSSVLTETSKSEFSSKQVSGGMGPSLAPTRGRGTLTTQVAPGTRNPHLLNMWITNQVCGIIKGPFVTAMGKTWCPEHFCCSNAGCRRPLQDIGFVEDKGQMYCENCFEQHLAPVCNKCHTKIKGNCLNALDKSWHPDCFICIHCKKPFGSSSFYMEDGNPYCETDWNDLFTTKCIGCGFPIEAGDRWVEALNNNYHSQCFRCSTCQTNLEGQSFYAKGGKPFCKNHAR
ncbi:PDZ and LIM domain protein Zasp [Nymphon striatum]|nr:PDZ and LIM domain protein Zasp [Nymphon striatum]